MRRVDARIAYVLLCANTAPMDRRSIGAGGAAPARLYAQGVWGGEARNEGRAQPAQRAVKKTASYL